MEIHHIFPICEGGKTTLENLKLLCLKCHKNYTAALEAQRNKVQRKERMTAILRALQQKGGVGATTKQLCAQLGRAKTPLSNDLKQLRNWGYIERDKQAFYYVTSLGREKLDKCDEAPDSSD
jgi:hypothetical protein